MMKPFEKFRKESLPEFMMLWEEENCEQSYNAGAAEKEKQMLEFAEWWGKITAVSSNGLPPAKMMPIRVQFDAWKTNAEGK